MRTDLEGRDSGDRDSAGTDSGDRDSEDTGWPRKDSTGKKGFADKDRENTDWERKDSRRKDFAADKDRREGSWVAGTRTIPQKEDLNEDTKKGESYLRPRSRGCERNYHNQNFQHTPCYFYVRRTPLARTLPLRSGRTLMVLCSRSPAAT